MSSRRRDISFLSEVRERDWCNVWDMGLHAYVTRARKTNTITVVRTCRYRGVRARTTIAQPIETSPVRRSRIIEEERRILARSMAAGARRFTRFD